MVKDVPENSTVVGIPAGLWPLETNLRRDKVIQMPVWVQSNEKFEAYGQSKAIQDPLDEKLEVLLMRLKKAEEEISKSSKSKRLKTPIISKRVIPYLYLSILVCYYSRPKFSEDSVKR